MTTYGGHLRLSLKGIRALLALALLALLLPLTGCGMKVFGRRIAMPGLSSGPGLSAVDRQLLDAREQAALAPAEPYWLYRQAEIYAKSDSGPQAERALEASLARDPAYAPALAMLSRIYFESGRYDRALALLEPVRREPARFAPESRPALLAGLALNYDAIGRADLATEVTRGLTPAELERAGSALVYLALRGESADSAGALAATAVREDGGSAVNQNNFGIAKLRTGDPTAAKRAFLAAIDREPALAGPYYNLAIVEKFFFFDDAEASKWFRAYRSRAQDDPDSLRSVIRDGEPRAQAEKGN
jgi:tetratricopeptide (TPR) repeat protein